MSSRETRNGSDSRARGALAEALASAARRARPRGRSRGGALLAAALCLSSAGAVVANAPPAWAGDAAASGDDHAAAAKAFAQGQQAFQKRDFKHAAESFESAYRLVPHPDALWNAARSWQRVGDSARAANLYAQYLDEAPPESLDRDAAIDALRELSARLARIEIHAAGFDEIRLDGEVTRRKVVYVNAGGHIVEGRRGDLVVTRSPDTAAGASTSVALVPPDAPPPPAEAPKKAEPAPRDAVKAPPAAPPPERSSGLPPALFYVGAALTVGSGAALVWSGLDTLKRKRDFDDAPTQDKLDGGRVAQTRTNVLIATTAGLGALTAVIAPFVFSGRGDGSSKRGGVSPSVDVGVGPGFVAVRRAF